MTVALHKGESLVLPSNLVAPKQKNTSGPDKSLTHVPCELLSESQNELDLVNVFSGGENTEELASELPELYTEPLESDTQLCHDDCSTSELDSLSGERALSESSKIPVLKSESLNDSLSSSDRTDESKDSVATPLQLTGAALARRLNVSPSTLRQKKNARNFGQWTKGHDPDGFAWYFDGQQFVSVLPDIEVKPFE